MEIEILKEKETPLLSRKRLTAFIHYKGSTPSRIEVLREIAKKTGVNQEHIVIKHIYPVFGANKSKVVANIYETRESLERLELGKLIAKHKEKESEKDGS
ncbi:MAG: hypothetical protein QXK37_05885 [Candidatus Woesearchaeota archaeon]